MIEAPVCNQRLQDFQGTDIASVPSEDESAVRNDIKSRNFSV